MVCSARCRCSFPRRWTSWGAGSAPICAIRPSRKRWSWWSVPPPPCASRVCGPSGFLGPHELLLALGGHLHPAVRVRLALFLFPATDEPAHLAVDAGGHAAGAVQVGGPGRCLAVEPDACPSACCLAHDHQWNGRIGLQHTAADVAPPGAEFDITGMLLKPVGQLVQEFFLQIDFDIRLAHVMSSQRRCSKTICMATSRP